MAAAIMSSTIVDPVDVDRWPFRQYLCLFALFVAFYIGFDLADGRPHNGDTDDLLRAIQVRTLLQTGNWYDLSLPMVRDPEAYVSPWSRLVDLPYALIALALRAFAGQQQALNIAFKLWPPLMACIFSLLSVAILGRIAPRKAELPLPVLLGMVVLMPYAIWEFSPGRIDHHNVQMLLLLAIGYGLARFDAKGGLAVGIAVPMATAVGLETLPVLAVALLAVAAAWCFEMRGSARVLQAAGIACGSTTLLLMIMLIAPSSYFTLHNDAFSAPYVEALVGFGLLAALLPQRLPSDSPMLARCVIFTCLGMALVAGIFLQYPALRQGPFPMIDALAHRYWFDRIHQEMNALIFFHTGDWTAIELLAAMVSIAIFSARPALLRLRRGEPGMAALCAFAYAALAMTFLSNRFLRLAVAIVPLLLPLAVGEVLGTLRASRTMVGRLAKVAGVSLAAAAVIGLLAIYVPEKRDVDTAFDYLVARDCDGEDFSAVNGLSGVRLMTTPALGLQVIRRNAGDISVSSIAFHRASATMSHVIRTFMAQTTAERMALMKGFDYLVVCRAPRGLPEEDSMPLFAALMADRKVPGLEPVPSARPTAVMLFRIDRSVTQ